MCIMAAAIALMWHSCKAKDERKGRHALSVVMPMLSALDLAYHTSRLMLPMLSALDLAYPEKRLMLSLTMSTTPRPSSSRIPLDMTVCSISCGIFLPPRAASISSSSR